MKTAINGQLQGPEGWNQASAFFAHPSSMPQGQGKILIVKGYSTQQASIRGNHAEVVITYRELGQIDPSLRFHQPLTSARQITATYLLVYARTSANAARANGSGTRQWRIQNPPKLVWTGLPAAIRYVTEARANTNNAATKKNADGTLSQLQKLQ
ncbi:MAG TPA: hypothetical protein VFW94_07890 [Candidatus Acidoferrales bacterium]|nr:hypothetical protein [Candidatus Acidoferrales bacterium]